MKSTNRTWQHHLRAKGLLPFFFDRLKSHALSSSWQFDSSAFHFPVASRDEEDDLSRAFFEWSEEFPYDIFLEVTNRCNLSCRMCARAELRRPLGVMSMELFRSIADQIAENRPETSIHLYHIGEPLLDPLLQGRIACLRSRGLDNVGLFTNGQRLLDDGQLRTLAEAGLNTIGVDLDGFSPATYARIRVGGEFERVRRGIEELAAYLRSHHLYTRLEVAYHIYPGLNEDEIAPFVAWCEAGDLEYKLVTMHVWTGVHENVPITGVNGLADMHHGVRTSPCCGLWNGLVVDWDGKVPLCFQDSDQRECVGDLRTETIEQIWKGRLFEKRRQHVQGRFEGLCRSCPNFANVNLPGFGSPLYPAALREPAPQGEPHASDPS